jgi:hypothetical protein
VPLLQQPLLTSAAPWASAWACCAVLQGDEQAEKIVPALTGVFAEALKGGVSNLSFGDLSGQLGGWQGWALCVGGQLGGQAWVLAPYEHPCLARCHQESQTKLP